PREVQWFINSNKDEGRRPQHLKDANDPTRSQLIRLYAAYEEACTRAGVVDNPELLAHYRQRFRHVLVDEFQDTNAIQYEWIKQLAAPGPLAAPGQHAASARSAAAAAASCPFVVGDDDQCLAAGTPVTLADGSKRPIEAVSPGDLVMSSYGSGASRPAKVTERL